MDKIKIAYICHFSTELVRRRLHLRSFFWGNILRQIGRKPLLSYNDAGVWNADIIKAFENNAEYECHVISHHLGLRAKHQLLSIDGVCYHFIQEKENLIEKIIDTLLKREHKQEMDAPAQRINDIVGEIQPDIVIVCGAENPIYSSSVLKINNKPIYVLLQTLLNDPKRLSMGVGNELRRDLEKKVLAKARYFGSFNHSEKDFILQLNPQAICLRIVFPFSCPQDYEEVSKEFDFVFFANGLSRNKGAEDALTAFATVVRHYPSATLNMIGNCSEEVKKHLVTIMKENRMTNNVTLHDHFPSKNDVIRQVKKARYAVLPSITAPLNSTVREVMMLGIPAIVYETSAIRVINTCNQNVLTAKMEDIEDLGQRMLFAYNHPREMNEMAISAQQYAKSNFTVEAVAKTMVADIKAIIGEYYYQTPIPQELKL